MITRQDYIKDSSLHRKYWAQFVNNEVKARIYAHIGLDKLLSSTDEHLNDIPLKKWDKLGGFVWAVKNGEQIAIQQPRTSRDIEPVDYKLLKSLGEGVSSSAMVCIYKEAARQIIEEHKS